VCFFPPNLIFPYLTSVQFQSILSALGFCRGYFSEDADPFAADFHVYSAGSFLADQKDLSVWESETLVTPLIQTVLLLLPLPAIAVASASDKQPSEEVLVVLGILCVLPLVLSGLNSVRLLGLVGIAFSCWQFYDSGKAQHESNRLI
jgi:hypothetical protein